MATAAAPRAKEPAKEPAADSPWEQKRGRGRPPGSANKRPGEILTTEKLAELYNRAKPYLDPKQKKYLERVLNNEQDVDPVIEMELLARQLSLLFSEATVWAFEKRAITQDFAKFAGELRQSLKDLEDMKRRRREEEAKRHDDGDGLVDVTRKPSVVGLQRILGGAARG